MESTYQFLLTLGGVFLVGQAISTLGHRTSLPRVTLLLIFGVIIGKEALNIIPPFFSEQFDIIAEMTLMMVGFLIGGKLTMESIKVRMGNILWISVCAAVFATTIVTLGLIWIGLPTEVAVLLGCIAAATAPAATFDVVMESKDKGPFGNLLISIVALDDAWALIIFGIGLAIASTLTGHVSSESSILMASKDIGGAIILGICLGFPAAYLTGRLKPGEPILTEALGIVFICGGFAIWLEVSFLIASIVMGATVANFAKHHEYPFHAIENVEWPFMVIFFVLAGATLEMSMLNELGLIGLIYILCRILGKFIGVQIGGQISGADKKLKNWMSIALFPQAGVSIGMALVASSSFPQHRHILLPIIFGSTIFFEIIGPIFTRMAIHRTHTNI